MLSKIKGIIRWLASAVIFLAVIFFIFSAVSYDAARRPLMGATFSKRYSQYLGLSWKDNYLELIKDIGIKYLRLPTYWDEIEPQEGKYDFKDLDWEVDMAKEGKASVVMVLGMRQPRWPECFFPSWLETGNLADRNEKLLAMVRATVEHFKSSTAIEAWQVENEPLLASFGICPQPDQELVKREVALVKSLDPARPVVVTASGELSTWHQEAQLGNILGTTMYRTVWNVHTGYFSYWFVPAAAYRIKAYIQGIDLNKWWIAELQLEPWFPNGDLQIPLSEQYKSMSPQQIIKNVDYASRANPARIYVWGAEWWYYTKVILGTDEVWNAVKTFKW